MLSLKVSVDFSKKGGRVKPLHCINGAPRCSGNDLRLDFSEEYSEIGVPCVRTNTTGGDYGYNQFVNIHCIFPDFDADECDEASYNFHPTDLYLASIKSSGAEIFYRLGESSEPYARKIFAKMPRDPEKWARICEHIIMHYNEGWANGFKLGIKYFEIWNAPDCAAGLVGDSHEYFELYRVTANYLHERFPRIKLGAYGSLGFASLNRLDASEELKAAVPFMQQFLSYLNRSEPKPPLDFFTWACHAATPEELALHSRYARSYLDSAGFKRTKSIVCEFNAQDAKGSPPALRRDFPTYLAASMILAQKSAVDMMMYATADPYSPESGVFGVEDFVYRKKYAAYAAMCAFGGIYRQGSLVECSGEYRGEVYSLAAASAESGEIMLVVRSFEGRVEIALEGCPFANCRVTKYTVGQRGSYTEYRSGDRAIVGGRIILPVKEHEIYRIALF